MNVIHVVPISAKKFTENDLEISKKYINPDVYPGYYDNSVLPKDFQYVDRRIVPIKSIGNYREAFDQIDAKTTGDYYHGLSQHAMVRLMARGANADEVIANLNRNGFELSHVPISVCLCPDGKIYSLDGRTRIEGLTNLSFVNVIVDYYVCKSWQDFFTQAISRNRPDSPRSPMTTGDIVNNCNGSIREGWLTRDPSVIRAYVINITHNKIKKETLDKICHNVMYGVGYSTEVLSLNEVKAKNWLKTNGYHDNENNNGIFYKVVPSSAWSKSLASTANTLVDDLLNEGKKVKELRVVIHTGTLEGADPSKSWKNKIDQFRRGWNDNLKNIEGAFFNQPARKAVIKLYGAIPAVSGLSSEYPMDKMVMFHLSELKNKTFDIIDEEKLQSEVL